MPGRIGFLLASFILGASLWVQASAVDASPKDCYLSFLSAVYYAKDLSAVAQYFPKAQRDEFKTMTPQQQQEKLKEIKTHYVSKPKFLTQKIDGTRANLTITGLMSSGDKAFTANVNVDMIKEGGYWRIAGSSYSGEVQL